MFPTFTTWQFAAAGALCALGPVAIHLLNRRRFRVVHWAAMDFLREALERNRRIMQLRDILLMLLRCAAVLFFGLALAQPFWASRVTEFDASQPLHAVLIIDNSLSMGYESLGANSLERAKERAREFIATLPGQSRITVVPLCGSTEPVALQPYRTAEEASDALRSIRLVDRPGSIEGAIGLARAASDASPELAKRVVLFSDQQAGNWKGFSSEGREDLPDMQVVDVSPDDVENSWISEFSLRDRVADNETPAVFVVRLRHGGAAPRENVQVTLNVNGVDVAAKNVTLDPSQGFQEVTFSYLFDSVRPEAGEVAYATAKVTIPADRLPADDERALVVPVVAGIPVVFVDQYGAEDENPALGRRGETLWLRRLLVPMVDRDENPRNIVRIRHVKIDDLADPALGRELLKDARVVVVAGVADPAGAAPLLREYVEQGGQLLIAAGGQFDAGSWNSAYNDGAGILPLPLSGTVGALPAAMTGGLTSFRLAFDSLRNHGYFRVPEESEEWLRDFFSRPMFFMAVRSDDSDETLAALEEQETERLTARYAELEKLDGEAEQYQRKQESGDATAEETAAYENLVAELNQLRPNWLLWAGRSGVEGGSDFPSDPLEREAMIAAQAEQGLPRVLARFDNDVPFMIERNIDRGRVVFVSTGILPQWNTLARTDTVVVFDRVLRGMIESTLPQRNFDAVDTIALPIETDAPGLRYLLRRPSMVPGEDEVLDVGFLDAETRGLTIRNALEKGIYEVTAESVEAGGGSGQIEWRMPLAVGSTPGEIDESELAVLSRREFEERVADGALRWVAPGEEISLAGTQVSGQNAWWYLALFVLLLLIFEIGVLAWPAVREKHGLVAEEEWGAARRGRGGAQPAAEAGR